MELFKVVTIDEAKQQISQGISGNIASESVSLLLSVGRVLCKDIKALVNVPGFTRSSVDGYAVQTSDVAGASEAIPAILELKGEVTMGQSPEASLDFPGECIYVPTGGMLPQGADGVVMIEYTDKLDDMTILCNSPIAHGENIVEKDEDIRLGETVLSAGTTLRPYDIGVLAGIGVTEVEVYKKPRIGIISTGDEIVDTSVEPLPGQVRDINTYLLHSLALQNGAEPIIYGVATDDYEVLRSKSEQAYKECDVVLISGGSSVGKKDQTLRVLQGLANSEILVHGLAVKPGKPTIIARAGKKILFGLPGHPLAAAVIYTVLVKYYINLLRGVRNEDFPISCKIKTNYHKAKGREEFLPVKLQYQEQEIIAEPIYAKSGLISGFSKAWGFIRISKNLEGLKAGEKVLVYPL